MLGKCYSSVLGYMVMLAQPAEVHSVDTVWSLVTHGWSTEATKAVVLPGSVVRGQS